MADGKQMGWLPLFVVVVLVLLLALDVLAGVVRRETQKGLDWYYNNEIKVSR